MAETIEVLRRALSDRYRVERPLGRGGMATVYLAQDLKHDRPVAIKVLRPELASILGPERFLREIQIAAKLNHPHILALHDSGEAEGLLYYVMPQVTGESLLQRIDREKQLPIEEALRLAREVASALAYAHAQGVVHRDIKPANILLSEGYALVADFGLALAVSSARESGAITHSGITIGTPAYMSPEQSAGEAVDGRSDLYALGCVLYEMLAGDPPFTSSNPGAILARHASAPVPPIRVVRTTVPPWLEKVIMKLLEKAPADRYQTAEALIAALVPPAEAEAAARAKTLRRWRIAGIGAALVAVAAVAATAYRSLNDTRTAEGDLGPAADTSRFAVFPFQRGEGVALDLHEDQLLQQALGRWSGITVTDRFDVVAATDRISHAPLTSESAAEVARRLRVGRFVLGDVSLIGDSLRVHAGLYASSGRRTRLGEATVRVARGLARVDSVFASLADSLLFHGLPRRGWTESGGGTRSVPALQAFARGQAAIDTWDLPIADSAFTQALQFDPEYVQGALWLAQVRAWDNQDPARWRFAAQKAMAGRPRLAARDQILAQALSSLASREFETACPLWRRLTVLDSVSFAAWYGRAQCVRSDNVTIPDPRSPSRWRFRSSYQEAVRAYVRAFQLLPAIHRAFRVGSYERLRDLLFIRGNSLRPGKAAPPDTATFFALPGWSGDSLVFVPFPAAAVMMGAPGTMPATFKEAVLHQRQVFREIATGWAAAQPSSTDALEALAISLELLGDPSALDTLRRARTFARTDIDRIRVGAAEVWLEVKLSLPDGEGGLRRAVALADSLLSKRDRSDAAAAILVSLAALTGRVGLAAELSRHSGALGAVEVHPAIAETAPALLVFAAFGGPPDSLERLSRLVASGIENGMPQAARRGARLEYLTRAATLAFPNQALHREANPPANADVLYDAQGAYLTGRTAEVWRDMRTLRASREGLPPESVSFDALLPEALLLAALPARDSAIAWLTPALESVRLAARESLADAPKAAALVRAMVLRADLAGAAGDRLTAARWARAVALLWRGADESLRPTVERMTRLVP